MRDYMILTRNFSKRNRLKFKKLMNNPKLLASIMFLFLREINLLILLFMRMQREEERIIKEQKKNSIELETFPRRNITIMILVINT
jgi:hypothetical protein